jgi:hypothetical protein
VAVGVGAAALVGGAALYFLAPHGEQVAVSVLPGVAGLRCSYVW